MSLHPGLACCGHIFRKCIRSQSYDRQPLAANSLAADSTGGFVAVTPRHLHIHKHQIVRVAAQKCIKHHGNRFIAVMRCVDFLAAAREHLGGQYPVYVVIFGQQYSPS